MNDRFSPIAVIAVLNGTWVLDARKEIGEVARLTAHLLGSKPLTDELEVAKQIKLAQSQLKKCLPSELVGLFTLTLPLANGAVIDWLQAVEREYDSSAGEKTVKVSNCVLVAS